MSGRLSTPEADALRFAADWLRQYDDSHDGGQQTAVANEVATWLERHADAQEEREVARAHGMAVSRLRAAMAARKKDPS